MLPGLLEKQMRSSSGGGCWVLGAGCWVQGAGKVAILGAGPGLSGPASFESCSFWKGRARSRTEKKPRYFLHVGATHASSMRRRSASSTRSLSTCMCGRICTARPSRWGVLLQIIKLFQADCICESLCAAFLGSSVGKIFWGLLCAWQLADLWPSSLPISLLRRRGQES